MIEKLRILGQRLATSLLLGAALFAGAVVIKDLWLDDERPYAYAVDYDEAITLGLVRQGWLPAHLPDTMVEIHERHDLDSNKSVMRFTMSPQDFDAFVEIVPTYGFRPIDIVDGDHIRRAKNWIPQSESAPRIDNARYECFRSTRMRVANEAFLAVHHESRTFYFWLN